MNSVDRPELDKLLEKIKDLTELMNETARLFAECSGHFESIKTIVEDIGLTDDRKLDIIWQEASNGQYQADIGLKEWECRWKNS